jgi:hypothetical protein
LLGVALRRRAKFFRKSYILIEHTQEVWYNTNNWGQTPVLGLQSPELVEGRTTPRKGTACKMQALKCQLTN